MRISVTPRIQLLLLSLLLVQISFARNFPADTPVYEEESRDLAITHTLSHDLVSSGEALLLIFSLSNQDQHASQDIQIQLDLPEAVFIESYTPEHGEFFENEGIWKIQHLAGGKSVSLHLNLLNTSKVDLDFSASIHMANPKSDPITQNNVTQGVIKAQEEDCVVVYNDFSADDNESPYLYIDCVKQYPNNVLYIYDRWGNLVFEQEGYDNSWNGKRHPRYTKFGWDDLPKGTYYYVLSFPKAERADSSGWIYLSD